VGAITADNRCLPRRTRSMIALWSSDETKRAQTIEGRSVRSVALTLGWLECFVVMSIRRAVVAAEPVRSRVVIPRSIDRVPVDAFAAEIAGEVILPGDAGYDETRRAVWRLRLRVRITSSRSEQNALLRLTLRPNDGIGAEPLAADRSPRSSTQTPGEIAAASTRGRRARLLVRPHHRTRYPASTPPGLGSRT